MQKYKSREVIEAQQWFTGVDIEGVLIGKNNGTDRWDDTPNGAYIQGEQFKMKVNEGDWIIKRKDDKFLFRMTDKDFKIAYKLKTFSKNE